MAQHLKLIALLIFTLSASYTSAQSLRKLLERPYGIIESKWEKDAQGTTELNYYNEDYCDYYLYRANDRSYNLSNGKNTIFKINTWREDKFERSVANGTETVFVTLRFCVVRKQLKATLKPNAAGVQLPPHYYRNG